MSKIRIKSIKIKNYRSFGPEEQIVNFPDENYKKPISIVGYNNAGKTNLMNCILMGIGEDYVSSKKFELKDLHNLSQSNQIEINISCDSSPYGMYFNKPKSICDHKVTSEISDNEIKSSLNPSLFGANKHYSIFYINFHKIKDEINTQKTSWGNLKSFLGRHIKRLVDTDQQMTQKRDAYKTATEEATQDVLNGSYLEKFIERIKTNYRNNLRQNVITVNYGLPDYEDIFLQMLFSVQMRDTNQVIPLDHHGDGYVSMFIMAVIQAIAEENTEDKCLFLFEEPESFLHENHQEYFYKVVLCGLAEKGHQVIYTTHSARMVDVFETRSLIRLEFDDQKQQTIVKANRHDENLSIDDVSNPIDLSSYNSYIKNIEPNLNKILFSKKVILVEGPNDVMTYNYLIKKIIAEKIKNFDSVNNKVQYAEAYLNFHNIVIVPHHGKTTAHLLIELCKYIDVDCYVITDWDIPSEISITEDQLTDFENLSDLHQSTVYLGASTDVKSQLTNNWKLVKASLENQIHFNKPKLEALIDNGEDFDKDSLVLWGKLQQMDQIDQNLFPNSLRDYLEIDRIKNILRNMMN